MKICDINVFPVRLPMKQSFSTSGGLVGNADAGAPHVYVRMRTDCGAEGWGEARPSHRWSYETLETVTGTIEIYLKPLLLGKEANDLHGIHALMNREIKAGLGSGQPIAKAAVDMALHDLIGRAAGASLAKLWLSSASQSAQLSYLISTANPDEAAAKAANAFKLGYKGIDVKLGIDPASDIDILEAVKGEAPGLFIRADANQAYTLPRAVQVAKQMERIGIDIFEQPLRANQLLGHAELRRKTSIPIALDESIWTAGDVLEAIRQEACDAIVIKLTKMGGLLSAKLCGEIAREAGLELLGGGLTESGLGLSASAHMFNYLQIASPYDLNGPLFLQDDPVDAGPAVDEGHVYLPDRPGIGCSLSMDKIMKYSTQSA